MLVIRKKQLEQKSREKKGIEKKRTALQKLVASCQRQFQVFEDKSS